LLTISRNFQANSHNPRNFLWEIVRDFVATNYWERSSKIPV
jgi:hypothetical protein